MEVRARVNHFCSHLNLRRRELSSMLHLRRKAEIELLSDLTSCEPLASELSFEAESPLCRYLADKIWRKIERSRRIDT